MASTLGIGEFARLTYLSVPALRHYHETGVLAAGERRPVYRLPSVRGRSGRDGAPRPPPARAPDAAAADPGRCRRAGRARAATPDRSAPGAHGAAARADPDRSSPRSAGSSHEPRVSAPAEVRDFPRMAVLGVTDAIRWDDMGAWFEASFEELFAAVGARGIQPAGPPGGLFWPGLLRAARGAGVGLRAAAGRRGRGVRSRRARIERVRSRSRRPDAPSGSTRPVRRPRHHLRRSRSGRRRSASGGRRPDARGLPGRTG